MITIKTDQEKKLYFDLEISGSANVPEVRLLLMSEDLIGMVFKARLNHGTAKVVIPKLFPFLSALRGKALRLNLETILDGHHSSIWEERHVLIEEPVIITTSKPTEDMEETEIKVRKIEELNEDMKLETQTSKPKPLNKKSIKDLFDTALETED